MEWILGACTILGGAAAVWYFWDKITGKTEQRGVLVEDARSRKGGIAANDQTGRGVSVRRVDAQNDITASSAPAADDANPKAPPPPR